MIVDAIYVLPDGQGSKLVRRGVVPMNLEKACEDIWIPRNSNSFEGLDDLQV